MKLTYRGVAYEYTPIPVKMAPGEVGGKYRGVAWRHHQAESVPIHQSFARLKYRGVAYCIGESQNIQEREDAVAVEMEPGDGVFFNALIIHGSAPNNSVNDRLMNTFAYNVTGNGETQCREVLRGKPIST